MGYPQVPGATILVLCLLLTLVPVVVGGWPVLVSTRSVQRRHRDGAGQAALAILLIWVLVIAAGVLYAFVWNGSAWVPARQQQ